MKTVLTLFLSVIIFSVTTLQAQKRYYFAKKEKAYLQEYDNRVYILSKYYTSEKLLTDEMGGVMSENFQR